MYSESSYEGRIKSEARYIVENRATVRECGKYYGISKSSVHKDITKRLIDIDTALYEQVRQVLDINKAERHIRGGMATRNKYMQLKNYEQKTH